MAEAFIGSYILTGSDKFDEYLKALGVNMISRSLAASATPVVEFSKGTDDKWLFKTTTPIRNIEISFKLGEEFEETSLDGRKCKSVISLENGKLVHKQKALKSGEKDTEVTREIKGDDLIVTMPLDDVVCTRTYKRQ